VIATLAPLWVTSRAAGIAAIVLAGLTISAGLLMATRSPLVRGRATELRALHEALRSRRSPPSPSTASRCSSIRG
jgi:hypothetical protein